MRLSQVAVCYQQYTAIITNISILLFEKTVTVGMVFFCEGIISRLLGVSLYGKWLYSINTIIVFSSIVLIAGSEVVIPALVRHRRLRWQILSSVFLFRFVIALFSLAVALWYANFIVTDQDVRLMLTFLACALIFNEPFSVIANLYQARTQIGIVVAVRLTSLFLRASLVSIAFWLSSYLIIYSTRAIEALFLAVALSCAIVWRGGRWRWHKKVSLVMLNRGAALWMPLMLMLIYMRLDRFFIEYYLGFEQLAMYGVASQMLEQGALIIGIVVQSIAPTMLYGRRVKSTYSICFGMLSVALVLQLLGCLWLDDVVSLIFGQHYQSAANIAILMLPSLSFLAIDNVLMQRLYRDKKYTLIMWKWLALSIISVVNYWLWLSVFRSDKIYVVYVVNSALMMIVTIGIYSVRNTNLR